MFLFSFKSVLAIFYQNIISMDQEKLRYLYIIGNLDQSITEDKLY